MVAISIIIRKDSEKCYASTVLVNVLIVFDTKSKKPSPADSAKRGREIRDSKV